jgi:hypothetical protein
MLTALLAVAALLIGITVKFSGSKSVKKEIETTTEQTLNEETLNNEASTESSESTIETKTEEQPEPETEIVYPAPQYEFKTDEITVEIENIDREYRFAWVSDVHIISDHNTGGDVSVEYLDKLQERYETLPVDENGIHSEDLWGEIIKFLNYENFDGVIFGGDIMDYCSSSNVSIVKEGLDSLRMRYMYIRSDHDYGNWYGNYKFTDSVVKEMHQTIDGDEISHKFWDMGDFIVMGVDNSYMDMPQYYLDMIEEVYNRGKPVIMATHVPYASKVDDSLAERSMSVRNTLYYWGGQYVPNDVTSKYLDLLYDENTVVKQVLAGHLHASWDGMMTGRLSEHIFAPSYEGNIGIIKVIPK